MPGPAAPLRVWCTLWCAALAAGGARAARAQDPGAGDWERLRDAMVADLAADRWGGEGVRDPRVLEAMRRVPRHLFVPPEVRSLAYGDHPLPIGHGQTISQPYIVAKMTELVAPRPGDRVLEVGTGSGYQAAVLSLLAGEVYSIEILPELGAEAAERLRALGYRNVEVRIGDGYRGWPDKAPFDAIVVTAAPPRIPPRLVEQLKPGGRMVLPVGPPPPGGVQWLMVLTKGDRGPPDVRARRLMPVQFVPMVPGESLGRGP